MTKMAARKTEMLWIAATTRPILHDVVEAAA
jgi:hypothetical protein